MTHYEKPSVACDIVCLAAGEDDIEVLLVKRGHEPYKGCWALPGGFAEPGESLEQTAARELQEETALTNVHMQQLATFSEPGRDPRGWVISCAYWAVVDKGACKPKAGDDAAETKWARVSELLDGAGEYGSGNADDNASSETQYSNTLVFDHASILAEAIKRLRRR
jgi:8-oxo-dGTP diphosphatase